MCNGDFGMYRVMPWAYPTIPGQSSGGASVDPIPETKLPYDFDNASTNVTSATGKNPIVSFYNDKLYYSIPLFFDVSGIEINDITNVSTVNLVVVQNNLNITPTSFNANSRTYTKSNDIYIAWWSATKSEPNGNYGAMTNYSPDISGKYEYSPSVNFTVSGSLTFKYVVIDSNGETIQESKDITVVVS